MRKLFLTLFVLVTSLVGYSQHTIIGELEDLEVSFKFKDSYNYVEFGTADYSSGWLRVKTFETSKDYQDCKILEYITADGIVTAMFCDDNSIAAITPGGDIYKGWMYTVEENYL